MIFFLLLMIFVMLFVLMFLMGIGFRLTGALLAAVFWTVIEIPLGLVAMVIGFALCCTIILLPLGLGCMKAGVRLIVPGI